MVFLEVFLFFFNSLQCLWFPHPQSWMSTWASLRWCFQSGAEVSNSLLQCCHHASISVHYLSACRTDPKKRITIATTHTHRTSVRLTRRRVVLQLKIHMFWQSACILAVKEPQMFCVLPSKNHSSCSFIMQQGSWLPLHYSKTQLFVISWNCHKEEPHSIFLHFQPSTVFHQQEKNTWTFNLLIP